MLIFRAIFKYTAICLIFPIAFVILVIGLVYYNRNVLKQIRKKSYED